MLTLNLDSVLTLTSEQFYQLCLANPDLKLERNAQGAVVVTPPTGGETGNDNAELVADFVIWFIIGEWLMANPLIIFFY